MAIAKTLHEIPQHPLVQRTLDRRQHIEEIIEETFARWTHHVYELYRKRHPAPAYIARSDGVRIYQGTDFDLLTLLTVLSHRRAVINIPAYESLREHTSQNNRRVIANENRHGQLVRLISHLESHSFSVLIIDYNVAETQRSGREKVGAPRSFAVVDDSGKLYEGWYGIEWSESPEERRFIEQNNLEAFRGNIRFKYPVTPALASSFYSQRYLVPAIIESRRLDEVEHYKKLAADLREQKIKLPFPPDDEKVVYLRDGQKEPLKVENLEAKAVLPRGFNGNYPLYGIEAFKKGEKPKVKRYTSMPTTLRGKQEVLRYCLWHVKKLAYKYGPMIRIPTRMIELAFFLYGINPDGTEIKPSWAVPEWERDYKEKLGAKTKWNKLDLGNVHLLYRIRDSTVHRRAQTVPIYVNNWS